jgi:hypothetical protein
VRPKFLSQFDRPASISTSDATVVSMLHGGTLQEYWRNERSE